MNFIKESRRWLGCIGGVLGELGGEEIEGCMWLYIFINMNEIFKE